MAGVIDEKVEWPDTIYQLERNTPVLGGPNGPDNRQAQQLASRTLFLRGLLDAYQLSQPFLFYQTDSDPDGTLMGLASTANGRLFCVSQGADASASFFYYVNDNGIARLVARLPGSAQLDNMSMGYLDYDGKKTADIEHGHVIFANGTTTNDANWDAYYLKVRKGDTITYSGTVGSVTAGEVMAYIIQLNNDKVFIGTLANFISEGRTNDTATLVGTATQDGLVYVRVRVTASFELKHYAKKILTQEDVDVEGGVPSYDSVSDVINNVANKDVTHDAATKIIPGVVIFRDGTKNTSAGSSWKAYYIPVEPGDEITFNGKIGTSAVENVAWIIQLDESKGFVAPIASRQSTGVIVAGKISGTATQRGFAYVRVRIDGTAFSILKLSKNFALAIELASLAENEPETDYTGDSAFYRVNYVMNADGSENPNAGNNTWLGYFLPVDAGDDITLKGVFGSAAAGENMAYIIQLDANKSFVKPIYYYVSTGANNVAGLARAQAIQSGFIYVRARISVGGVGVDYSVRTSKKKFPTYPEFISLKSEIANQNADGLPSIPSTLERLPRTLDTTQNYNGPAFTQDNVYVSGDYTYVVGIGVGRYPWIIQRNNYGGPWNYYALGNVPGNPFSSPGPDDGHNNFSMVVTKDGYIIVSGNHHGNVCRAAISNSPNDISAWTAIKYTDATNVTYPRFVKFPDGTVQAFWREGSSGDGLYYSATFDDATRTFQAKRLLIGVTGVSSPYEQRVGVGKDGSLHLCWGYRTNGNSANSNYGLFYAKSMDKGATWTSANGQAIYGLPLNGANSERIVNAPEGNGYVNQNGGCCDRDGRYHTVLWQYDADGNTQVNHVWFDGTQWHQEVVTKYNFRIDLTANLLIGDLSRPLILCTRYGKVFVITRTQYMGLQDQIRAIDVTTPGAPREYLLARFDIGSVELSVNTDIPMNSNNVMMMVSKGTAGWNVPGSSFYTSESAYLLTAPMP